MKTNKPQVPKFATEEEEAEFWDKHSPLEFYPDRELKRVNVRIPKEYLLSIRLDSETRRKLEALAKRLRLGPSTLARLLLHEALERRDSNIERVIVDRPILAAPTVRDKPSTKYQPGRKRPAKLS